MLLRNSAPLSCLLALALASSGSALQERSSPAPRPITTPVRELRVRLDSLTTRARRQARSLSLGATSPIYDNTCASGYYLGLASGASAGGSQAVAVVDQGRVPNTSSAQTSSCTPGNADLYHVPRFQIGYCTTTGAPVAYVASFWDAPQGSACPDLFASATSASITVLGLPRSPAAGTLACYLVTVDLGTPGFTLTGGANASERFAWGHQLPATTGADGPILAGNPSFGGCAPCVGTAWERPTPTTNAGTGLDATTSYWLEDFGGGGAGCMGSTLPFGSFHLQLDSLAPGCACGQVFCDAFDGAHALCPCGASDSFAGCDIAQGPGVRLDVLAQLSGPSAATLQGTGYPPAANPTAIVIRGNNLEPTPVLFGDGLRCVGVLGFARLAATTAAGGVSTHAFGHSAGPGTFYYQVWFRNTPASYCVTTGTAAGAYNLTNGHALTW